MWLLNRVLPDLTLIRQQSGVDGSFLIATFVTERLQYATNTAILLVAAAHGCAHYSAACAKLNFKLDKYLQYALYLQIMDVGESLHRNYPAIPSLDDVRERILLFLQENRSATIVIDDLSFFLNFGNVSEAQLLDFVETIMTSRECPERQAIVLKVNNAELYEVLCANLDDWAGTVVELKPMSSGNFSEVDGMMCVQSREVPEGDLRTRKEDDRLIQVKDQHDPVLFKVHNRKKNYILRGQLGIKNL